MLMGAIVALLAGGLMWVYRTTKPPTLQVCPNLTSPQIKLRDGRHLAYKTRGTPKETATFKVICSHGCSDSKEFDIPLSDEWLQEMNICIITFDRPGYCKSDPNPRRSPKTDALDIEELADQLDLGPKFHLLGLSLGVYPLWGCLKYIPQRLAGVAFVVPMVNYWWPSLPGKLCSEAYDKLPSPTRWTFLAYHHAPCVAWLFQKLFPMATAFDLLRDNPSSFNPSELETMKQRSKRPALHKNKILQQGAYESEHRDFQVMFGKWEFDPLEMSNPLRDSEGSIHLWIGMEDTFVWPELNRHIAKRLPWIRCQEVSHGGHMFFHDEDHCKMIYEKLVVGVQRSTLISVHVAGIQALCMVCCVFICGPFAPLFELNKIGNASIKDNSIAA